MEDSDNEVRVSDKLVIDELQTIVEEKNNELSREETRIIDMHLFLVLDEFAWFIVDCDREDLFLGWFSSWFVLYGV